MKDERIEGIGSIHGGEYDTIYIEGIGKLKGDVVARRIVVDGLFKSKGRIDVDEMKVEGVARAFRDIRAKTVDISGMLKVRRASLNADKVICEGIIVANQEVSADEIYVDGICSVSRMYGDNVVLKNNRDRINGSRKALPVRIKPLIKLYFGRDVSPDYSTVDVLECTNLEADGIRARVIRANKVKLNNGCIVDRLFCDGEISIDDTCRVGKIIFEDREITLKKEMSDMANMTLVKILDLYKDGKISADEAEKMINSLNSALGEGGATNLPWGDDGKLRIVAFVGRRLLKKGDPGATRIEVKYEGPALDVECYGNLSCGDVDGHVNAMGNVTCDDVGGHINAGGSITCGNIDGNVSAGGNVYCKDINGSITAGGGVHLRKGE